MKTISRVSALGLDIAKNSFALHGFDDAGHSVIAKELKQSWIPAFARMTDFVRMFVQNHKPQAASSVSSGIIPSAAM